MKYINQLDYPEIPYITRCSMEGEEKEKGKTTTIKSSGCGLCCCIMVVDRLLPGAEFDLIEARDLSYECSANQRLGTSYLAYLPPFCERFGLRHEITGDPDRLRQCLRTGGCAIALVDGNKNGKIGVFSHVGHYIVVLNEEPDGRLAILDPAYKEGKYEIEGRQGKVEMKNGVIALTQMETLQKDCDCNKEPFYLFWRK